MNTDQKILAFALVALLYAAVSAAGWAANSGHVAEVAVTMAAVSGMVSFGLFSTLLVRLVGDRDTTDDPAGRTE